MALLAQLFYIAKGMENGYATVTLNSWNEYKSFVDELSDNWIFRGQASAGWGLQNAIERTDFINLYKGIEADFVAEFQRGARNYLTRDQIPEHLIEWLALMQHHGAPTRLLDFSKSPFIAAFFGFEIANFIPETSVSIWAIHLPFLKTKALEKLAKHYSDTVKEEKKFVDEALFEKIFYDNTCSLIFPVEPFRMNRRYSLQQSIFISTGNAAEPFMQQLDFLEADMARTVIKIELPSALQKEVLRDLQKMNLSRASLFPDLDGYAGALRLRYNSMRTPEEMLSDQLKKMGDDSYPYMP
ncbi:MAG: hypothetical protein JWP88_2079 [Flaviaesturariibacter sp.]|nr:hypothetical protein [Flaviaesturariibacter sp.]